MNRQQPKDPMNMHAQGPDFTNCGNPVDWVDQVALDEHFVVAVKNAKESPGVDIELMRWSAEHPLAGEYTRFWELQRGAIRRATLPRQGFNVTVARRTDKGDGVIKCYVRYNRARPKVVAAA